MSVAVVTRLYASRYLTTVIAASSHRIVKLCARNCIGPNHPLVFERYPLLPDPAVNIPSSAAPSEL